MDEDLIVLGAQAETPAAGGEVSDATAAPEGQQAEGAEVVQPGTEQAEPAADAPKPDAPKGEGEEDGDAEKPKKRSGIQRMQDRIARLEAERAELLSRNAPTGDSGDRKAAIEKEIGAPPKEADFEDYAAFEDAKADYRLSKALAEQRLNERDAQASRSQAQAREAAIEAFHDRMDDAREAIPDFDKVVKAAANRDVKPHVEELIVESEKGGLLAYYLAKTPAELARLNGMSPIQAAKAVGALEARLTLAKPKKATQAPAPAKPVAGGAAPSSPDAELDAYLAKTYGRSGR
ncbi:hypothetical protein [Methylobacterium sp. V23]|uniref:hypothetical protein n=1 Tax=Methylobacterium sp. V23 TaxID=2044878 RepID=UPI000CDB1AA3|nr:hypothetical protein [Methylobacterium sp. V23]POR42566.1 hypothetical protein CRT23_12310 [Methylobacterium sp. V23]